MPEVAAPSGAEGTSPTPAGGEGKVAEVQPTPAAEPEGGATPAEGESAPKEATPPEHDPEVATLPGLTKDYHEDFQEVGRKTKERKRGPDGKFLSAKESAEAHLEDEIKAERDGFVEPPQKEGEEGEPPAEASAEPAKPPTPEGETFEFQGKTYKDKGAAEHSVKSLQGMFKGLNDGVADRDSAIKEWQAHSGKQDAEIAELKSQLAQGGQVAESTPASEGATKPTSTEDIVNEIDFDAFELVAKKGGSKLAGKYLAQEILGKVQGLLEAQREAVRKEQSDLNAPAREAAQEAQMTRHADGIVQQIVGLKDLAGNTAFPEAADGETLRKVGQVWRSMGGNPKDVLSAKGLITAISLYRTYNGLPTGEPAAATPPAPENLPTSPVAPGAASLSEAEPRGNPGSGPRSDLPPEMARIARELDSADLRDKNLGFAVRRVRR